MAVELHKVRVRTALKPRREPYWGPPLGRGRHVGLRKIDDERATWVARLRPEGGVQTYRSLGYLVPGFDWDEAKAAAVEWFKAGEAGVTDVPATVEAACKDYVADREREKGKATARDAEARFERTVYDTSFGRTRLDRVRTPDIRRWRDGLGLGKASANRTLSSLKAAFNLAVSNRRVTADRRLEWSDVKPHKDATQRRTLFLDLKQRRAMLAAAGAGALRDLLEAAMTTGGRAGELVSLTRASFDARTASMTFKGKTGRRTVPLAQPALVLFTRLAKGKLPSARLLVREDGQPWAHSDWDELVREAAEKAKLPTGTVLYTLRHSFITQALHDGMTTLDVARLTGTSVMMIEKHYGHLVASAAAERLKTVQLI
ncbi:MAG: site-specific integrase [Pseudomonadota bacterium]